MQGAYYCMGVYKHDAVMKMGAYIHGVLTQMPNIQSDNKDCLEMYIKITTEAGATVTSTKILCKFSCT